MLLFQHPLGILFVFLKFDYFLGVWVWAGGREAVFQETA